MKHIAPRNPHPRRRVRRKQCTRVVRDAHKVMQRILDSHNRWQLYSSPEFFLGYKQLPCQVAQSYWVNLDP